MKIWVMLNYDLGLKGDYQSLYRFLDNHRALDCGNCNAAFEVQVSFDTFDEICEEIRTLLSKEVVFSQTDRIYLTVTDKHKQMRGKFLFGGRRRAVWEGYGDIPTPGDNIF